MRTILPVAVVVAAIVAFWYLAAIPMNIHSPSPARSARAPR